MGVFNATANQVLVSPVTNYYKGKAIRQEQADKEQMSELRGLQIEGAKRDLADSGSKELEKRRLALQEAQLAFQNEQLDYGRTKFENEVGKEVASKAAFDVYSITQEVNNAFQAGGKTPRAQKEGLGLAANLFGGYASGLPDGEAKNRLLEMLEGGVTAEEYQAILPAAERNARYYGHIKEGEGFTLAEGAQRYDAQGELVAENIKDEGADEPTAKEAEIAEYVAMGRSHEDAVKLAYDKITVKENTKTGMMIYTDTTTTPPTVKEVPVAGIKMVDPKPEPGRTLWALKEFATGPANAMIRGIALPAAWMGMSVGTKSTAAKQTFQTTTQSFIRAMALSERYAIGEQDRIRQDLAMLPALLDDPMLMGVRMVALDDDLALRQAQAENDSIDTSLNPDIRQEAAGAANRIKNYRALMGVPARPKTVEEAKALPKGTLFLTPDGTLKVAK